jgi:hypothetical protein
MDSSDLRTLTFVLSRFDNLPYVLAWTTLREVDNDNPQYVVDNVELTRLQLNLRGVPSSTGVPEVLLRNGQQLLIRGGTATHMLTTRELPLEAREPLFRNGQEVLLRGSTVLDVATGRAVRRSDALFRNNDMIRITANSVEHVGTSTVVPRLDRSEAEGNEAESELTGLTALQERIGAVITFVGVSFKNVPAVFVGKETPITLKDIPEAPGAEIIHSDAELSFACFNEALDVGAVTVTLHSIRESVEELIDLSTCAQPPVKCNLRNVADCETWRLNVVEMPELYLYRPPSGVWPEEINDLVNGIPHGVLMVSETQELIVLVPNVRLDLLKGKLQPDHGDADWEANVAARVFRYHVHVSKRFLLVNSLASAMYLCVMRFLSGGYEQCFDLADSIVCDTMTLEQQQIFMLFRYAGHGSHVDGHHISACLCKVALAVQKCDVTLPFSLEEHASRYVAQVHLTSVTCRLTETQELQLFQLAQAAHRHCPTDHGARAERAVCAEWLGLLNRERYLRRRPGNSPEEEEEHGRALEPSAAEPYENLPRSEIRAGMHYAVDQEAFMGWMRNVCAVGHVQVRHGQNVDGVDFGFFANDATATTSQPSPLSALIAEPLLRNGDELRISQGSVRDAVEIWHTRTATKISAGAEVFSKGAEVILMGTQVVHASTGTSKPRVEHVQSTPPSNLFKPGDIVCIQGRNIVHVASGEKVARCDPLFLRGDQVRVLRGQAVHLRSGKSASISRKPLFLHGDRVYLPWASTHVVHLDSGLAFPLIRRRHYGIWEPPPPPEVPKPQFPRAPREPISPGQPSAYEAQQYEMERSEFRRRQKQHKAACAKLQAEYEREVEKRNRLHKSKVVPWAYGDWEQGGGGAVRSIDAATAANEAWQLATGNNRFDRKGKVCEKVKNRAFALDSELVAAFQDADGCVSPACKMGDVIHVQCSTSDYQQRGECFYDQFGLVRGSGWWRKAGYEYEWAQVQQPEWQPITGTFSVNNEIKETIDELCGQFVELDALSQSVLNPKKPFRAMVEWTNPEGCDIETGTFTLIQVPEDSKSQLDLYYAYPPMPAVR